jgi:hypothetical protein
MEVKTEPCKEVVREERLDHLDHLSIPIIKILEEGKKGLNLLAGQVLIGALFASCLCSDHKPILLCHRVNERMRGICRLRHPALSFKAL